MKNKNSVATPLMEKAYKLHKIIYRNAYPYPVDITIKNHTISVEFLTVFKFKYIPLLLSIIVISFGFGFGCCVFIPLLKLFFPLKIEGILPVIVCIFLGSAGFLQFGTYFAYCKSTEIETLMNQLFKFEQNYCHFRKNNSIDWPGILLVAIHIVLAPSPVMLSLVGILLELDPFFYVFELILPSPYYRSLSLIVGVPLVRFLLGIVCVFEFQRFFTVLLFLTISAVKPLLECMKRLNCFSKISERSCIDLYSKLRILVISGDYFIRHYVALLLTCGQIVLTSFWWIALKCGLILPSYFIIFFYLLAILTSAFVILLLPQAVEISEKSMEFVKHKRSSYHTFNRYNKNYHNYLLWKSHHMLPIRFGVQFTLNRDTPTKYLEVTMTNLTNAVFLINP